MIHEYKTDKEYGVWEKCTTASCILTRLSNYKAVFTGLAYCCSIIVTSYD
jgi:hypothetical protein